MRPDLELVAKLIQPNSRVLDLGCGAGDLLQHLQQLFFELTEFLIRQH